MAQSIKDNRTLSDDWVYEHIFNMSEDEIEEQRNKKLEDLQREFRYNQIAEEGNDPSKTGQSFGTPHDIVSMQMTSKRNGDEIDFTDKEKNFPEKPGDTDNIGRPEEHGSTYGTHKHPMGWDPLGAKVNRKPFAVDKSVRHKYKGGSPLARESVEEDTNYKKIAEIQNIIKSLPSRVKLKSKKILMESIGSGSEDDDQLSLTFLDESSLLDNMD